MAENQSDAVHARLRAGILALRLAPGERISERGLEAASGASRTPVRAALSRLDAEGLVRRDGRGWIVAPLDLAEIVQVVEYREAVETAALAHAVDRATPAQLDDLDALLGSEPDGAEDGVRRGEEFHVELAKLSANPFLVDGVRTAMTRLARIRWLEVITPESRATQVGDHRAIAAAVRSGDAETAARLAVAHARAGRDHALDLLAGDRARGLRVTGPAVPTAAE